MVNAAWFAKEPFGPGDREDLQASQRSYKDQLEKLSAERQQAHAASTKAYGEERKWPASSTHRLQELDVKIKEVATRYNEVSQYLRQGHW